MKIAVLREKVMGEKRVALTPEIVKTLIKDGFKICIEKDAGLESGFTNEQYTEAGALISQVMLEIVSDADFIVKVQPSPLSSENYTFLKENSIIIGLLSPHRSSEHIKIWQEKKITAIALEYLPRITRAQSMDTLSSQNNLLGYRAVIEASYYYNKAMPLMMTAAGKVGPARVLVLGVGVAGLQAIATAKRLGCVVTAYDVRPSTKEQVESLGGKFICVEGGSSQDSVYAKETSDSYNQRQEILLGEHLLKNDIIISTAQIPGKKAPILITKMMLNQLTQRTIIIDLAAAEGGNCEATEQDAIINYHLATINGLTNIISNISHDASKLYAKNIYNFITYLASKNLNLEDELIKSMVLTHQGQIFNLNR